MKKKEPKLFPEDQVVLPPDSSIDTAEETPSKYLLPRDKDLPPVIRELVQNAPQNFKVPTFFSAVTCLCALATRVRVYYVYDGMNEHALLLQCIVCGEQSSGKSFARNVEHIIMKQLKKRDDEQRRKEQEYRELKQTAAKNAKLPDPPKTVIRTCPISISIAQLIKRADAPQRYYGCPMTLWSWTDELSAAVETNKRAFSNTKTIQRTSWDLHSTYGVDYLSDNAYSATVDIMQCSLYLCTPNALDTYADKSFIEGGGASRTLLVQLDDTIGDDAPIFKILTEKQQTLINDILTRMDADVYSDNGTIMPERYINMQWLFPLVQEWCKEQNRLILKSGSRSHNTFFKRASVTAFRIATLCAYLYMIADENKELPSKYHKRIKQIYLFCAQFMLDSLLAKWGHKYDEYTKLRVEGEKQVRVPIFDQLTNPFSREQLDELVKRLEVGTPTRVFISKWKAKGWIKETQKYVYQKNEKND